MNSSSGVATRRDHSTAGSRERVLGAMPLPSGDQAPETALRWPERSPEERLSRLLKELGGLGARICVAEDFDEARAYIERLVDDNAGEVIFANLPEVDSLRLSGPRFYAHGTFPASDAAVSVTQADYAVAETGSVVLFSEAGEGRILSLLAPVNVAVVPASRILWNVSELLDREARAAERSSALIFVTGPSRTADIELTLTVGVHGPGELHVIIVKA